MTSNNFWRINLFLRRIKREWGMHPSDVIGMLRFDGKRWIEIAEMMNCSQSTISRYLREEDKGYYNLSPEGRKIKQQTARELNEKMSRGEVTRGGFSNVPLRAMIPGRYDTASRL